ncbi:hypothetical protein D3C86_735000 [compost metagenome]
MHERRRRRIQSVDVQVPQYRQLLQVDRALRPDAAFGHGIAAVLHRERLVVRGPPVGQIGFAQQAAVALPGGVAHRLMGVVGVDLVGDEAAVPDVQRGIDAAAAVGAGAVRFVKDARVGGGDGGRAEQGVRGRYAAVGQPHVPRTGPFVAEQRLHGKDGLRDARHQGKAVARVVDGRAQHVGQFPGAVIAQQGQPGAERARHGGGQQADAGHQVQAQAAEMRGGGQRGRRTLAAQRAHALFAFAPEQDGHFAAGSIQVRFHDLQRETARHGRVVGIAAALQHAHGHLRGQPVRGRDHAVRAAYFGAGGEGCAHGAIPGSGGDVGSIGS